MGDRGKYKSEILEGLERAGWVWEDPGPMLEML